MRKDGTHQLEILVPSLTIYLDPTQVVELEVSKQQVYLSWLALVHQHWEVVQLITIL